MDDMTVNLTRENLDKEKTIAILKDQNQQIIKQMTSVYDEAAAKSKQTIAQLETKVNELKLSHEQEL